MPGRFNAGPVVRPSPNGGAYPRGTTVNLSGQRSRVRRPPDAIGDAGYLGSWRDCVDRASSRRLPQRSQRLLGQPAARDTL